MFDSLLLCTEIRKKKEKNGKNVPAKAELVPEKLRKK